MNKPTLKQVKDMMKEHPALDFLMCETLLTIGSERMGEILELTKDTEPESADAIEYHIKDGITIE